MKNSNKFAMVIGLVASVAALIAALVAFLVFWEKKKKDEQDLEEYLDYSIQ